METTPLSDQFNVQLTFFLPPDIQLPLAGVLAVFQINPEIFESSENQGGVLTITYGKTTIEASDILIYGVPAICHGALIDMAAGGIFETFSNIGEGSITMAKIDAEIEVGGRYQTSRRFPAGPLAQALFALGVEFRQVATEIWSKEKDVLLGLERVESKARKSLSYFNRL